jgi:hypothetical protein
MEERIDDLSRQLGRGMSRRKALALAGAALGGTFAMVTGRAQAAPRTCVVCQCGTGQPCNVKLEQCQETRGFPATTVCQDFCQRAGQRLCGTGSPFHCPQGCTA